jgi:hypothetical protein
VCDRSYGPSPDLRTAVTRTTVSGLVSAPFPVYSFAFTLHPLSSLPLDSQYTLFLVPGAVAQLGPSQCEPKYEGSKFKRM